LTLEPSGNTNEYTTEAGGEVELAAYLNEAPKTNVTLTISTNGPTEGMLPHPSILVFTDENWDIPQYVVIILVP